MGLVLTRCVDEGINLTLAENADPALLLEQLRSGGISIIVRKASGSKASIEIVAPTALRISRDEEAHN